MQAIFQTQAGTITRCLLLGRNLTLLQVNIEYYLILPEKITDTDIYSWMRFSLVGTSKGRSVYYNSSIDTIRNISIKSQISDRKKAE